MSPSLNQKKYFIKTSTLKFLLLFVTKLCAYTALPGSPSAQFRFTTYADFNLLIHIYLFKFGRI